MGPRRDLTKMLGPKGFTVMRASVCWSKASMHRPALASPVTRLLRGLDQGGWLSS